jgi:hypothetical protein
MNPHVMFDDGMDAFHFVVAEVEGAGALGGNFRTLHVMVEKADAACLIKRFCFRLANIVIQRGEEKQGTMGTVYIK